MRGVKWGKTREEESTDQEELENVRRTRVQNGTG